ncbi:hypothetical protein [Neisseria sp. LACPHL-SPEC-2024-00856]
MNNKKSQTVKVWDLYLAEMKEYQNNIQAWAAVEFGIIWEF